MSCNQTEQFVESMNDVRNETGLRPLSISEALDLFLSRNDEVETPEDFYNAYLA